MAKNIRKELVTIYQNDPNYFKERLKGKLAPAKLKVAYDYLDNHLSLYQTGKNNGISKVKTREIVAETLKRIGNINIRRIVIMTDAPKILRKEDVVKAQQPLFKKPGQTLEKQEFDAIKEMFFRGEPIGEIMQLTGRAHATVTKIKEAASYEEYKTVQQTAFKKPAGVPPAIHKKEPPHYSRLREFREQLDEVLIEFIKAELEAAQKEIMLENHNLRTERQVLLNRIEALEHSSFTKKLHEEIAHE